MKKYKWSPCVAKKLGKDKLYVPQRGDIVWIDLDPSRGAEIKKTRSALVISPLSYNRKVRLVLLCPITTHEKGYPFEVKLPSTADIKGVILADQVKSLDWKISNVRFKEKISLRTVTEVVEKLSTLIDLS